MSTPPLVRCLVLAAAAAFSPDLLAQDDAPLLAAGAVAPDFPSHRLDGATVHLADFAGKVVVLDFWATWCGPCKASMPHVQAIAEAHADDVVVLAVCTSDSRAKFEQWTRDNAATFPNIVFTCDPRDRDSEQFEQRASSSLYHVSGLPTKFVIGRDGKVLMAMVGAETEDWRLEAGLARAGLTIDPEIARKGEEQGAAIAKEEAERAAAAAKRPSFWPVFGSCKAGDEVADFTLVDADGKPFTLSSLRGKPVVLAFAWADIVPTTLLQTMRDRYTRYGVEVVLAVVSSEPEQFAAWRTGKGAKATFRAGLDPAGKYHAAGDAPDMEAIAAFAKKTVIGRFFAGGMTPAMPAFVAIGGDGKLLGAFGQKKWDDALGNLLGHAGVELAPADQPAVAAPPEAFVAPAPRKPEAPVTMLAAGAAAPDFAMEDVDGKPITLQDFAGKVVVLDFWATWCGPCKAAMPHVEEVAKHFADQGVVVVASCTSDERANFVDWVRANRRQLPHVVFAFDPLGRDENRASRKLYGVSGIPQQFVIGKDGKIAALVTGYMAGEVLLEAALAKAGVTVDAAVLEQAVADQKRRDEAQAQPKAPVPAKRLQ
ncbi:MAG: redoxin domain-containing protein [Planctomycetes bacterium]|nr:redoxin domain-containing protein [Planctomycetota bacterium]